MHLIGRLDCSAKVLPLVLELGMLEYGS
jgi:hypothetical protein